MYEPGSQPGLSMGWPEEVMMRGISGTAAGVPFLAIPPEGSSVSAPLILAWHFHDPPRSEVAMAAALPLRSVAAWRVYLGVPLSGSRLPKGSLEEFLRLGYEDAVLNLMGPACEQAVAEFPAAIDALRTELPVAEGPVGLLGGSIGGAIALSVLVQGLVDTAAVALVSPALQLTAVVAANERRFEVTYPWTEEGRAVAAELDFVTRVDQVKAADTAMLLVVGEHDDRPGIIAPAERLNGELAKHSPDRNAMVVIPDMGHALAEEPGLAPAPQTSQASRVDAEIARWFNRHLIVQPEPPTTDASRPGLTALLQLLV